MKPDAIFRALASDKRLQILDWLRDPRRHFPPQVDGDLLKDGVCGVFIADKLGVSAPTLSEHMRVLMSAGLVKAKRAKGWTFYQRNEEGLKAARRLLKEI
jgi:ArsR family transcriptional regulator